MGLRSPYNAYAGTYWCAEAEGKGKETKGEETTRLMPFWIASVICSERTVNGSDRKIEAVLGKDGIICKLSNSAVITAPSMRLRI